MNRRALSVRVFARADRGSVLIIVIWICFGLVALVLYFAQSMSSELRAADNRVVDLAAREAVEGGARYVTHVLSSYATEGKVPLDTDYVAEALPVGDACFWLIGRDPDTDPTDTPAWGLVDEASKLNLNTASRSMLEALPGMTPELAGAIIDWRDSNQDVGENGAEDETYGRLDPPRHAKNARFETVDELRLVYGATLEALFGEDTNRNGALDPNEDDADANPPHDDANGILQPGVLEYVTVYSSQPNTRADGSRRLNVTSGDYFPRIQNLLTDKFGADRASGIMSAVGVADVRSVAEFMVRGHLTATEFAQIHADLTATNAGTIRGLVNINTAPEPVLACLPGIGPTGAASIVAYRLAHPDSLDSFAWLTEVLDPAAITAAGPYITDQSYQFSADIAAAGRFGRGYARVKFVFDVSKGTPRIVFRQDLTGYGWALGRAARESLVNRQQSFQP